jgi:hypothetical protein
MSRKCMTSWGFRPSGRTKQGSDRKKGHSEGGIFFAAAREKDGDLAFDQQREDIIGLTVFVYEFPDFIQVGLVEVLGASVKYIIPVGFLENSVGKERGFSFLGHFNLLG